MRKKLSGDGLLDDLAIVPHVAIIERFAPGWSAVIMPKHQTLTNWARDEHDLHSAGYVFTDMIKVLSSCIHGLDSWQVVVDPLL